MYFCFSGKKIIKLSELKSIDQHSSWKSWGFNWMVRKPVSWAYSTLVTSPLSWTYNKLFSEEPGSSGVCVYILLEVLQEQAEVVLKYQQQQMENSRTDCIVGQETLFTQWRHLVPDRTHFEVILTQLCNDNKCVMFTTESGEKVYRAVHFWQSKVTAF